MTAGDWLTFGLSCCRFPVFNNINVWRCRINAPLILLDIKLIYVSHLFGHASVFHSCHNVDRLPSKPLQIEGRRLLLVVEAVKLLYHWWTLSKSSKRNTIFCCLQTSAIRIMSLENMTGSPPGLELGQAKQLSLANYSNSDVNMDHLYLWNEALIEGFTLLIIAALGIALNIGVLIMIGINSQLRKWMTGFAVHGCLLDIFKVLNSLIIAMMFYRSRIKEFSVVLELALHPFWSDVVKRHIPVSLHHTRYCVRRRADGSHV